ncbi:hypothetical protein [Candidatus Accumulibacter sp. ACC003]|uniref:Dyp-type peroxidase n=1 Tax=Candidatus Accumulibacter sp. ACC003 TaxID=2823334 RepID=UPI0025B83974|nr:hypothetical protein [Candidatus Accumulibacter sp. ACC003]
MPLDLASNTGPIALDDPDLGDFLADLQGNILNGHGRDHAVHIFIAFKPGKLLAVKEWISRFAETLITSAKDQLDGAKAQKESGIDAGLFAHFALSASGYDYLGVAKASQPYGANPQGRPSTLTIGGDELPFYSDSFQAGLKSRREALLDPPAEQWQDGFAGVLDALIILADDNPSDLTAAELAVRQQLHDIATIETVESGLTLRRKFEATVNATDIQKSFGNVVEHFGYADGVSQPLFVQDKATESSGKYWPHAGAPLNLVLVADPNGRPAISFGSFLVFRKLEQNVRGFKTAEARLAKALGLPRELAGALAVGRYEDGTPAVLQPGDGIWAESSNPTIPNDFNYHGDPDGRKCPFHAHVRKSNPRLESVKAGGVLAQNDEEELGHRIARRGITYGGPLSTSEDLDELPSNGVGLLFMCYQSDIWEQFEFIQRFWCNNPLFLKPAIDTVAGQPSPPAAARTGLDAVIGQKQDKLLDPLIGEAAQSPLNWPSEWGKATVQPSIASEDQFGQFVTLKGGEYFFSPSLSFLRGLGAS